MEAGNKLLELLKDLAEQLPSLLTILACMVFAITRWKMTRRVSQVVLIGLVLLFLHLIVFSVVYTGVPEMFIRSTSYPSQASTIRIMYLILGLINNSSLGVSLAVLLTGIFIRRPSTNHQ